MCVCVSGVERRRESWEEGGENEEGRGRGTGE